MDVTHCYDTSFFQIYGTFRTYDRDRGTSGNISGDIVAKAGVEIKVAYSAVLGTGSYVVNVTIGDMAASDVMLVA